MIVDLGTETLTAPCIGLPVTHVHLNYAPLRVIILIVGLAVESASVIRSIAAFR